MKLKGLILGKIQFRPCIDCFYLKTHTNARLWFRRQAFLKPEEIHLSHLWIWNKKENSDFTTLSLILASLETSLIFESTRSAQVTAFENVVGLLHLTQLFNVGEKQYVSTNGYIAFQSFVCCAFLLCYLMTSLFFWILFVWL